jgi:hypothetical protein
MVMEVDSQGLKSPVGTWDFNAEQLRASWKQGLLTSGYVLTVGWQTIPRSSRIKILASFTLEDGRRFEAEKDLSIKPPVEQSMSLPGSLSSSSSMKSEGSSAICSLLRIACAKAIFPRPWHPLRSMQSAALFSV